ncbi:MAG: DUF3048 domain-containing protein [Anaerolineae bacterium]|nr:DUF3048 domain-containing protein [Anaerolineae bacterium]
MPQGLIILFLALVTLSACIGANTPPEIVETVILETVTKTPTPVPAMSILTATPTEMRPPTNTLTPTSTRRPASPTPASTPTPIVYVIEEYDTLLDIALEFETTAEAILAANGLNENDFLQIGQELIIPNGKDEGERSRDEGGKTTVTATIETVPPAIQTDAVTNTEQIQESASVSQPHPPHPAPTPSGPPPPDITHPANINPLTGLPVDDPAVLRRRPLMVRIGNDPGARPQVGLNSADVVYEEITEWWVTRFTAIFLSQTPTTVAPIRSARLINVQLVPQYQGALAHSGGSDAVRWEISQVPIANLDEFYNPQPYFYRPNEGWQTRLAINAEAARNYLVANNLDAPVALSGFLFSDTIEGGEPAENIFIAYPRATSFTQWSYDAASGQYLRFVSDLPLVDFYDGQVSADNVIIYFAEHQETDIVEDTNGATSIRIIMNGRGPAWFFRDGVLNKGYWETDGSRTPYFACEDGSPYSLKPGHTWVEVVPTYFTIGLNSASEAGAK